ncbi:hypothetical protein [Helicobacter sp. T3_23-1059]
MQKNNKRDISLTLNMTKKTPSLRVSETSVAIQNKPPPLARWGLRGWLDFTLAKFALLDFAFSRLATLDFSFAISTLLESAFELCKEILEVESKDTHPLAPSAREVEILSFQEFVLLSLRANAVSVAIYRYKMSKKKKKHF